MALNKVYLARVLCQKSKHFNLLNQIPLSILMLAAAFVLLVDIIVVARFSSFIGCLIALFSAAIIVKQQEAVKFFNWLQTWGCKQHLNIAVLVFCLVGIVFFLDYTAFPADAQFFNQTEGWLRSSFPMNGGTGAGGTDIYKLVFNTLRAIFVLYLAVALVRVIAAARNDEDWQTLARTPLIILITVTMGDILAGLITGGGGGAGGT